MILSKICGRSSKTNVGLWRLQRKWVSTSSKSVLDRAVKDGELRVFIVAGEVSGDTLASRLMNAFKKLAPVPVCFSGVGG